MTETEREAFWKLIEQEAPQSAQAIRTMLTEWGDWPWNAKDSALGIFLTFGPLIARAWFTGRLHLRGMIEWQDMAAMLAGFGIYWLIHSRMLRAYGCPKCQAKLTRQAGKGVRFPCPNCQRVWLLGDF
ncbi:MAG: hypothetical protein RLZZ265_2813 [Verrucomicrobiota bacterium]|jgi:hypothetical protein